MADQDEVINDKLHWYKDAIIYELHIKAFRDSNRDGIGDFKGLIEKLDYLQDLGATAIWLLPFYPSPLKDDGYDIADYYSIHKNYGTLNDFKMFLKEAHSRNLKVITELVINHTSDQHPWFQRARTAQKGSPERNYYVWTDDPNQYKDVRIIFQDFETSNWTWDPVAQQYYWHRFFHHQPDLNFDNPLVQDEVFKTLDYWCAMGVDGFRLDAIPYLFEREGTNGENLPETHEFLKRLRKHVDELYPGTALLAEANMWPEDSASYFGDGDECHMNYHFPVMPRMFMSVQLEDRYPITDIFDQTPEIPEICQWAIFLRNHDELTLEMVTDEERDFMYKVYVKDPKAKINLGIRHRLAPLMDNNRSKIELMNSLLFSLHGTPVLYYGDEIGMGDNYYLGDRDGVRTPMQWSADRNAGFSEANPQQLYLPVIYDPEYHYEAVNVEMQTRNTSSLFWFLRRMINMRKNYKAFSRGTTQFINVDNPKVLAFIRRYKSEVILVVTNLSKYAQPAEIDLREFKGYVPMEMFSKNNFPVIKSDRPYFFTLHPYSFQWFILQKTGSTGTDLETIPTININEWSDVLKPNSKAILEASILPGYFKKRKWFQGKQKKIFTVSIKESSIIAFKSIEAFIVQVEVTYTTGLPEFYQLCIAHVLGEDAGKLIINYPEAVIAQLKINNEEALLCDAYYLPKMHQFLIQNLAKNENVKVGESSIYFKVKDEVAKYVNSKDALISNMHTGDENNTSIIFDNRLFLKMYRKIDKDINPDTEISSYLSEEAGFKYVPRFFGTIEWEMEGTPITLGILQELVENHGDGYSFMMERLNNYFERVAARNLRLLDPYDKVGTSTEPVAFEELPELLQTLLGNHAVDHIKMFATRTADLHLKLLNVTSEEAFKPEKYSLHYQRSIFSSIQGLIRESFQSLNEKLESLPEHVQNNAKAVISKRDELLNKLKIIYRKKLEIVKIRIHGTFGLRKILLTGKDMVIHDFGGNPLRSYSERRIKRSPLRDVAEMMTSIHYAAREAVINNSYIQKEDVSSLQPFAEQWSHYMSGFYLNTYLDCVEGTEIIPKDKDELNLLLNFFRVQSALHHLIYELNNRPDYITIPLEILSSILEMNTEKVMEVVE